MTNISVSFFGFSFSQNSNNRRDDMTQLEKNHSYKCLHFFLNRKRIDSKTTIEWFMNKGSRKKVLFLVHVHYEGGG